MNEIVAPTLGVCPTGCCFIVDGESASEERVIALCSGIAPGKRGVFIATIECGKKSALQARHAVCG